MKKLVKIFLITVCLLAFSGILASAATIDSISTYLMMVQFDDYFSAKDSPTTFSSAGSEIIDEKTGGVSIAKTDLSLPGKGGFDLNITRRFNSSMPMDGSGNLYYVTVGNSTSIYDPHQSVKYAFKYFIEGQEDGEPIYIAYDHVTDMLNAENGTNQIKVAESFSTQLGYGLYTNDYYSISYNSNDIGLTHGKTFHLYSELPAGDDITLVRDTSVGHAIIWIDHIHSVEFTYDTAKTNAYSGGGWIYDVPMLTTTSRTFVEDDDGYKIYHHMLLYNDPSTEKTACIFLEYKSKNTYRLQESEVYYYNYNGRRWETTYAYQYDIRAYDYTNNSMCLDITDYNGTKHTFYIKGKNAYIKSSTDRLGNTISYGSNSVSDNTITDTYGRKIDIEDDGIYVNGQKVVNYEYVVENNSSADPNDHLFNDDEHYFKVSYNTGTEDEGTTIYKYKHNNLKWYTSAMDEDPFVMTNDLDHFIMESITLPTGAETHYDYDYIMQSEYLEYSDKRIASVVSRYDIVENRQINKVDYEYNLSNYVNKTATAKYSGQNSYYTTKNYDEHNNLVNETQVSTQPGNEYYINTVYTYDLSDMGNYVPVKAVTTTAETANSTSKNVITEEYTYDDYENITKTVRDGVTIQSATYNEYNLPVSQYQFRGNNTYVGVENTISSNGKLITASKNAEHALTSGSPTIYYGTSYQYSSCGDVTRTVSEGTTTDITYAYTTYDETNPTANSLVKTYTVTNVPTIDGTNDEPTAQTVTVTEVYDYLGRLVSATDAKGGTTQYEYDRRGNVVKTTNADGTFATADYDYINNTIVSTDETGRKVKYEYDGLGNFAKGYMYDGQGWKLVTEREYDSFSNLSQVRFFNDNGTLKGKVAYTYYADKKPSSEIVTEGASTVIGKKELKYYPYNSQGSMKETVVYSAADNSVAIREYTDKYGYKTQDTVTFDDNTYTQSYITDYLGNILSVKDFKANAEGLSNTTSYSYDVTNKVLTETTSAGTITNTYNNTTGLLTSTKDRRGTTTTYTYDNMGRLTRESSGSTDTRYYYDINGNVAQTRYYTDSSNYNVTKNVYDSRNRLTDVITKPDENELVTRYVYDSSGRLLKVAEGLASVADTIDPDQHRVTEYAYDAYGNMSKQTDPMGDFTEYRYNLLGMLVSQTDKNGTDTNYAYDIKGNLLQKAYTTANGETDSITYTYDMAGNLTKMVDSLGTTEYNYDSIGNLLSEVAGNTVKAYTYDANGNSISYALTVDGVSRQSHTYTYDGLNRVASITDGSKVTTYTYDANGNVLNETSKEGTTTRKNTAYTYNTLNLPLTKRVTTGTGYENYTMTYDMLGNTKTVTSNVSGTSKSTNYNYDGTGRLLSETYSDGTGINYTYDKYNNMTGKTSQNATVSYVYDKNNRLVSSTQTGADVINNFNYYYDNNGNLITKTQSILKVSADAPSTSLGTTSPYLSTYEYDGWNRLTGATVGDTVASYAYKGDNLRQSKTVTDQNGTKTINFTYDGMNIVYDDDGTVTNNYVRGITGLIYRTDAEGTTDYFRTNQHGDVTAIASNTGATKQAYEYDAYGNQSEDTTIANPFQYCGEYYDEETGLIYLRNRYYDPSIARFITEDPIKDGLNWYAYCNNNPVIFVDPMGLWGEDVHYTQTLNVMTVEGNIYTPEYREIIAVACRDTDRGGLSPMPWGDQSYHFNFNKNGGDSRIDHSEEKLNYAVEIWNKSEDIYVRDLIEAYKIQDPERRTLAIRVATTARENRRYIALEALGQGLHALQDIDAHMQIFSKQSVTFKVHADGNGNTKTIDDTQYDMYLGSDGKYYPTESKGAYNSDRYKNTVQASINYLKRFKSGISK